LLHPAPERGASAVLLAGEIRVPGVRMRVELEYRERPVYLSERPEFRQRDRVVAPEAQWDHTPPGERGHRRLDPLERLGKIPRRHVRDRKSTRLNSSHLVISYAVFCLKKKK